MLSLQKIENVNGVHYINDAYLSSSKVLKFPMESILYRSDTTVDIDLTTRNEKKKNKTLCIYLMLIKSQFCMYEK